MLMLSDFFWEFCLIVEGHFLHWGMCPELVDFAWLLKFIVLWRNVQSSLLTLLDCWGSLAPLGNVQSSFTWELPLNDQASETRCWYFLLYLGVGLQVIKRWKSKIDVCCLAWKRSSSDQTLEIQRWCLLFYMEEVFKWSRVGDPLMFVVSHRGGHQVIKH